jgi:hypothetical protein
MQTIEAIQNASEINVVTEGDPYLVYAHARQESRD